MCELLKRIYVALFTLLITKEFYAYVPCKIEKKGEIKDLIFKSLSRLLSIYEQWAHVFHTLSIFLLDTKVGLIVEFKFSLRYVS